MKEFCQGWETTSDFFCFPCFNLERTNAWNTSSPRKPNKRKKDINAFCSWTHIPVSSLVSHPFRDKRSVGPHVNCCPQGGRGRKSHIMHSFLGLSWYTLCMNHQSITAAWWWLDTGIYQNLVSSFKVAHLTSASSVFMGLWTMMLLFGGAVLENSFCWKVSGEFQLKLLIFITSGKDQTGSWPKEEWKNCSSSKYWGIAFWNCPKHNEAISHHFTGFQLHNDFVPLSHIDDILLKNWGFVATLTS